MKEEPCFHRGKMDSTRDEEGGVAVRDPGGTEETCEGVPWLLSTAECITVNGKETWKRVCVDFVRPGLGV